MDVNKRKQEVFMDINALARAQYSDIPKGGFAFMVDKIGLRINSGYLCKENLEPWKTNNFITILTYGETAQINIHAEFEPLTKHLGKKCFNAICLLILAGVFQPVFVAFFMALLNHLSPLICFFDPLTVCVLGPLFGVGEWEWACDFLDYNPYKHIETDKANPKTLKKYQGSFYSRDDKTKRRLKENCLW
jgi:hypothetical protein